EFWATATVHHHAIRFKMDNKKHIVNLESFRDMLHICPRVYGQTFVEPPFEEEILAFIHFLGHSAAIRTLTDVEHKNHKKSNEMYYPRFTKVIIHHFMSKDPSIPRRNKFGALLPIELTNEEIKNSNVYKEYYAIAIGAAPLKPKASVRRTRSSFDTSTTPLIAAAGMESIFETTSQMDAQTLTSVAPLPMTAPTMTPSTISTITTTSQAPILPTTVSSTIIQNLPNFGSLFSFDNRLRTLEANFSESMQTNQFAEAVSAIPGIVQRYMD
nr:hypothetical protein [Tanacetum cinerariifolium]